MCSNACVNLMPALATSPGCAGVLTLHVALPCLYVCILLAAQGVCCASVLDAYGLCCTSGALDECGVCDGDGTSCHLHLRLLLQVQQGTNITDAAAPNNAAASMQLASWTEAAIQQALVSSTSTSTVQLHPAQVEAKWSAVDTGPTVTDTSAVKPPAARHLQTVDQHDRQDIHHTKLCAQGSDVGQDCGSALQPPVECPTHDPFELKGARSCSKGNSAEAESRHSSNRHLQQATNTATNGTRLVQLDIVLMSANVGPLAGSGPASGAGLLGIGHQLVSGLEQQAANDTGGQAAGVAGPQLLRVMLVQRVGVCGNGLCEVGERELKNADGGILQEAIAPCAQVGERAAA